MLRVRHLLMCFATAFVLLQDMEDLPCRDESSLTEPVPNVPTS